MSNVSSLLDKRFKSDKTAKMNELAKRSSHGQLSGFSGVFKVKPLSNDEQKHIEELLIQYNTKKSLQNQDLSALSLITSELKAINNQAIILHGERIKKAQDVLKRYKEGAFSAWLIMTYGNRQTPYNFLQYYEFYLTLSHSFREKIDKIPKQAIYTLASREGAFEKKEQFIEEYQGETKPICLEKIRKLFPLAKKDRRKTNLAKMTSTSLKKILEKIQAGHFKPTEEEQRELNRTLSQIISLVNPDN
ncbi:MAG: CT583 family protein [Simkaniaceae bacterium]